MIVLCPNLYDNNTSSGRHIVNRTPVVFNAGGIYFQISHCAQAVSTMMSNDQGASQAKTRRVQIIITFPCQNLDTFHNTGAVIKIMASKTNSIFIDLAGLLL